MPRLVLISDHHTRHDFHIPDGDVLVCAGDMTFNGTVPEIAKEAKWLKAIRIGGGFQHVVVTGSNHDMLAERDPAMMRLLLEEAGCIYLDHQAKEIAGIKFFGSGYTPEFGYGWALNVPRGPKLAALWRQIPDDTEVLVTHGPPMGRLDACRRGDGDAVYGEYGLEQVRYKVEHVGCKDLRDRITQLKKLVLHCYGHIHHESGTEAGADGVLYCNVSICDSQYQATNKPIAVDLEPGQKPKLIQTKEN